MKDFVHQDTHYDDRVAFFKLTNSHMLIPEVTGCIQVDSKLHVKLFHKKYSHLPPQWFRQGQDCRLSRKSMLENFPVYLESYIENISPIFNDLQKHMFIKKPVYSAEIVRYALLLRYTSIQSYRMLLEHFPLPSLSLLQWHDKCFQMCTDPLK